MESRALSGLTHILLYQSDKAEFHFAVVLRRMLEQMGSSFSDYWYSKTEIFRGLPGEWPFGDSSLGLTFWVVSSLEPTSIGDRGGHVR